ncbi:MAG: hypothetical protein KME45_03525 [Stenomitos rutilans HA7619-LM2]|jgi:hypothetical protein|nr:hypothetical protein [Stenomitos rutilans HA7619-LM2]MBW4469456.1 hypothetical protein [Stenomitos rutilans HA7619-LM2]
MPAVEFYARHPKWGWVSPLTLGPVGLQPGMDVDPGHNLISEEAIASMLENPFFAQTWQELQDSNIVKVLNLTTGTIEPDLPSQLIPAVKQVQATSSLYDLERWRDTDLRQGVQTAIAAQIERLQPTEPPKPTNRAKGQTQP